MNMNKNTVEGLEIISTKAIELEKKEFFKLLAKADKGLVLTIDRVGNAFKSKFKNDNEEYPSGIFLDYAFTYENKDYEIGIYYNLGVPTLEGKFNLNSNMNIFKIIEVATNLSKAEEIKVTEEFLQNVLSGLKFKAEIGTAYNGTFLIDPVEKLD